MIQEPSNSTSMNATPSGDRSEVNSKRYLLTVEVDLDALIAAYTDGDDSIQLYDLPSIKEIIEFEANGWLSQSGIYVKEVKEIQE